MNFGIIRQVAQATQTMLVRPRTSPLGTFGRTWYLGMLGALFALYASAAVFFVAMDPYAVYPWGQPAKIQRASYDTSATPWLLKSLTKSDIDTVYLGASTSVDFRPEDMEAILPGAKKAFNLALLAANANDFRIISNAAAEAPILRRAIVGLEASFIRKSDENDSNFFHIPSGLFGSDPTETLKLVNLQGIRLAWRKLLGQEYFVDVWDSRFRTEFLDRDKITTRTSRNLERLKTRIQENRSFVEGIPVSDCSDFPSIAILSDFVVKMKSKNAEVDFVFPPLSRAAYFEFSGMKSKMFLNRKTFFENNLGLRFCAIKLLEQFENVKFFEFDHDDAIVGNFANYADASHFYNIGINRDILRAIATDTHRLTLADFPAYAQAMRDGIRHYQFYDSDVK